jgi:hypothetical protein
MEIIWSSDVDSILSSGRNLIDIGVRNWALERSAALVAVNRLADLGIPVLGGDVYAENGNTIEPNCDSWHCERAAGESPSDFVRRSIFEARKYISKYQIASGHVYFALVPDIVAR